MTQQAYDLIKDWPLKSQLIEIQDRVESGRIQAQYLRDGKTINPHSELIELTENLKEIADWVGFVQRHHAP